MFLNTVRQSIAFLIILRNYSPYKIRHASAESFSNSSICSGF